MFKIYCLFSWNFSLTCSIFLYAWDVKMDCKCRDKILCIVPSLSSPFIPCYSIHCLWVSLCVHTHRLLSYHKSSWVEIIFPPCLCWADSVSPPPAAPSPLPGENRNYIIIIILLQWESQYYFCQNHNATTLLHMLLHLLYLGKERKYIIVIKPLQSEL